MKLVRFPVGIFLVLIFAGGACKIADPNSAKELNYPILTEIQGFDPALSQDQYTHVALSQVYQGLLQYSYLVRPYRVEPLLAESLPTLSPDEKTLTFRIRSNVFFQADAAFGGKPRMLKAEDFVYTFKRLADPKTKSPFWGILRGAIVGLDDFRERVGREGAIAYDKIQVPGLQAPGANVLILRLTKPFRHLPYLLAMAPTSVVPREAVLKYGDDFLNHAVGTGPFKLVEWRRGQKIVFERNPFYWDERYPASGEPASGQRLPFVDRMTFWNYAESQPLWLNFLKGNLDFSGIPKDAFETVFDEKFVVKESFQKKSIWAGPVPQSDLAIFAFNMANPLWGKNKLLRQAVSSAIDRQEKIRIFLNGRGEEAQGLIPSGLFGHETEVKNPYGFDPDRARRLVKAAIPKGAPPVLHYEITNSTDARQLAEAVGRDLQKIGIKMEIRVSTWPKLQERMRRGEVEFFSYTWNADYPDPETFLQLLYSKNASPGPNAARFANAEYDALYDKVRDAEDGPARLTAIRRMTDIVREEVPWVLFAHRIAYPARQGWVTNYKRNEFAPGLLKYVDVDLKRKSEILPTLR